MNSETLKTFITLAKIKNYTQTANQLFVAQSTITNRILELEKELGYSLFIRNHKQLQLTIEGTHFLDYAKRILELEQSALNELSNLNYFRNTIRIGTTNTIYECHLSKLLLTFHQEHPDTCLNLIVNHSIPLLQMLQDNIIDIAFTYLPYSKNKIQHSVFTTDTLLLVTSNQNTNFVNGIYQEELLQIPYYYCDFTFQDLGSCIKNLFPKNHPFPFTTDKSSNLLPFILNGKGYTFLPQSMVQPFLDNGSLLEIPTLDFSLPPITCYVEYKNHSTITDMIDNLLHPL